MAVTALSKAVIVTCLSLFAGICCGPVPAIGSERHGLTEVYFPKPPPSSTRLPYYAPLSPLPPVDYDYRYTIDDVKASGVATDRWERRQGDHVRGGYTLLEPDGRVRFVDYETDGSQGGFKAVVRHATPAIHLLSTQQLYRSFAIHAEPLVNRLARTRGVEESNLRG